MYTYNKEKDIYNKLGQQDMTYYSLQYKFHAITYNGKGPKT